MEVKIQLKNYRCFPDETATDLILRPGITAFIGANNSGKSSILRFFYELRGLFLALRQQELWVRALSPNFSMNVDFGGRISDLSELFADTNPRSLKINLSFLLEQPAGTIASYAGQGLLFATHNMGLARATADRIYSLQLLKPGVSKITAYEATPRLAEFLGEMSFSGYRELGFDKVLLVEGATDIKTVQQLLRLYGKDHRIVCMHLGGNSLINGNSGLELEELRRISTNISVLIDSERQAAGAALSADRAAFQALCGTLQIPCHVLDRRAIENYFSERAIQTLRGPSAQALGEFDRLGSSPGHWPKSDNWRIARNLDKSEIDSTDLGQFLTHL